MSDTSQVLQFLCIATAIATAKKRCALGTTMTQISMRVGRKREAVTVLLLVMLSLQKTIRDGTWQYVCKITPFHHQVDSCLPPFTRKEFSLFPVLKEPVPLLKVNRAFSLHNSLEWHCLLRVSEMYRSYPYLKLLCWSTKLVFYSIKRRWRALKRYWKCGPVACNLFSAVQQPRRVNSPPLELTS